MKHTVIFEEFTKRHYIRSFSKKYKGAWDKTLKSLIVEFTFVEFLFDKKIAETIYISEDNDIKVCKSEFKILGTDVSRHASGCRCIFAIHRGTQTVKVLLVYHKNDLGGTGNETAQWKNLVKKNYPEYKSLL